MDNSFLGSVMLSLLVGKWADLKDYALVSVWAAVMELWWESNSVPVLVLEWELEKVLRWVLGSE
jgi:hypothetical protein